MKLGHEKYCPAESHVLENRITAEVRYRAIVLDIELVTKMWSMEPPRREENCRPVYQWPWLLKIDIYESRLRSWITTAHGKSIESSLLPQNFRSGLASLDKRNPGSIDGVNAGIADSWGRLEKGKIVWGTVIGNSRRGTSDMGMLAGKPP